jgi:oxygen-dependent protoporphyrinogen oxidase
MTTSHVTVIGGGISGLAAAWWLKKQGIDVTVFEQDAEPGGTMKTLQRERWMIETGPNSALETTPLFKTLFSDLGIEHELVYANPVGKNRYILRDGTLHPLPLSPGKFFLSKLWSLSGKLRLLKEPFVGKAHHEESIAEFVERRLGREFLDYAINPFVAGVFAGAPEKLSVRAAFPKLYALEEKYGGLIRGQIAGSRERKKRGEIAKDRAQMFSFKNGMQTFPNALGAALGSSVRTSTSVEEIARIPGSSSYTIRTVSNGASEHHRTDSVLLAVPASIAASMIAPFDSAMAEKLEELYYPPVTEVFVGYATRQVKRVMDGFGFLVPEKEQRQILGAIWSSALFDNRSPKDFAALTVFVGGSRQPDLALLNDDELLSVVTGELQELMQISGPPVITHITRWKKAIPQYHLGHLKIVEKIAQFEQQHPGLFLSGNYRDGISVSDCIIQSEKMCRQIAAYCITRTSS